MYRPVSSIRRCVDLCGMFRDSTLSARDNDIQAATGAGDQSWNPSVWKADAFRVIQFSLLFHHDEKTH